MPKNTLPIPKKQISQNVKKSAYRQTFLLANIVNELSKFSVCVVSYKYNYCHDCINNNLHTLFVLCPSLSVTLGRLFYSLLASISAASILFVMIYDAFFTSNNTDLIKSGDSLRLPNQFFKYAALSSLMFFSIP